jgi:RecA-family ATPase
MSQEFLATSAHPSHAVALAIADICPEALFCGFRVNRKADGTFAKLPVSKAGAGVGADIDHANLVNGDELRTLTDPPNSAFWGIFMQSRMTYDPFGELVLTILDLDTKRSTAPRDLRMVKLMDLAKERGLLTERSHSKKGGHIIFLAKPDPTLPPQINLGNHQEVEIFGHPGSAGKNVMFTGDSLKGTLTELDCTVTEFFALAGIQVAKPEVKKPSETFDFSPILNKNKGTPSDYDKAMEALEFINPGADYETWLAMGFALHKEFGDRAKQDWMSWSLARSEPTSESDLENHWKSFGKKDGVGIGTLFHTAKQAGWEPPTKSSERRSAVDEFQNLLTPVSVATGSLYEPVTPKSSRWQAVPLHLDELEPIDYLIDGFFAHSFAVIAGQPGVGKTTAMLAVALIAAGFKIGNAGLKAEARRKIIYVSEDTAQVRRSLYAYAKHMNLDRQELQNYFVLVESIRSTADQVLELAHLVLEHTIDNERPWLIIDTANATLDIENENDNSQVGAFMAALKQTIYTQLKTSITIITHTAKTMATSDDSAMARGASAYTGDATLTAVLFMDEDKNRYLRLVKTRYEPTFREILMVSQIHTEAVVNRHGSLQEVKCVIVAPQSSSETDRKQLQADKQQDKQNQRVQDKCDQAVLFVQDIINQHQLVTIRKGSNCPKNPPPELANHYKLEWSEIYANVPGSDRGDTKKAIGTAILHHFNPTDLTNLWVQLA